jgi:hypothetical protein
MKGLRAKSLHRKGNLFVARLHLHLVAPTYDAFDCSRHLSTKRHLCDKRKNRPVAALPFQISSRTSAGSGAIALLAVRGSKPWCLSGRGRMRILTVEFILARKKSCAKAILSKVLRSSNRKTKANFAKTAVKCRQARKLRYLYQPQWLKNSFNQHFCRKSAPSVGLQKHSETQRQNRKNQPMIPSPEHNDQMAKMTFASVYLT